MATIPAPAGRVPPSLTAPLARFRTVAFWEGVSYLVLLLVAMPLKYGAGVDLAVTIVGLLHGLLFIAFLATLAAVTPLFGIRGAGIAFLASFVPGGTFWLESRLRQELGGGLSPGTETFVRQRRETASTRLQGQVH